MNMDNEALWEHAYSQHKKYLISLIFRMTGSLSETEEIVHDAFIELLHTDLDLIRSPRSWLTKVCINKTLNHMKLAYKNREMYPGVWLPDEIPESLIDWNNNHENISIETEIIRSESLTTSFLLLAENLSPEQRCVYILKEIFDYTFKTISDLVSKDEAACRKIFQRSKEALMNFEKKFSLPPENAQSKILEFFEHAKSGNIKGLETILTTNPELFGDGGGKVSAAGYVEGIDQVIKFMIHLGTSEIFNSPSYIFEYHQVSSRPGAVISERLQDGSWELNTVLSFEFLDGKIARIYGQRNPEKLASLFSHSSKTTKFPS